MTSLKVGASKFLVLFACIAALSTAEKVGEYNFRGSLTNVQQGEQKVSRMKPDDWIPCYLQIGRSCSPSPRPTAAPTHAPSSSYPTYNPTFAPTQAPTGAYQNLTNIYYALAGFFIYLSSMLLLWE
jgi:hypothetical protein